MRAEKTAVQQPCTAVLLQFAASLSRVHSES